jgi:hypothetical protein
MTSFPAVCTEWVETGPADLCHRRAKITSSPTDSGGKKVTIASFVLACVSSFVAACALTYSRGQKLAAERSAAAAEERAKAAVAAEERAQREEERNRFVWVLEPIGNDRYTIVNAGTATAFGVSVDAEDLLVHGETEIEEFPPGHGELYYFTRTNGTTTEHVIVTWHEMSSKADEPRQVRIYVRFRSSTLRD